MLKVYRKPSEGEFIVIGVDTAAGGVDYCAAQFVSVNRRDVPMVYHSKELASTMTPKLFDIMTKLYFMTGVKPTIAYERNNGGVYELEHLQSMNKAQQFNIYQTKQDTGTIRGMQLSPKLGWDTSSATRPVMLADLKEAIDNFYITIYDRPTITELFSFVVVQTTNSWKAQAENGMHDDLIMSLAIAWQLYQTERVKVKESKIINTKPPEQKKSPFVNEDGTVDNLDFDKLIANAIKDSTKPQNEINNNRLRFR